VNKTQMRKASLLLGACLAGLSLSASAGDVCEDPAFSIADTQLLRLHNAFNAPGERRVFTEVHYILPRGSNPGDPHLTVGMGHWTYSNLAKLFQRLKADRAAWDVLTAVWARALTAEAWDGFHRETMVRGEDAGSIASALDDLLCANEPEKTTSCVAKRLTPWSHKVGGNFMSRQHWFTSGWRAASVQEVVARQQVEHWVSTVVFPGQTLAQSSGVSTYGATAAFASAISSGGIAREMLRAVRDTNQVPPHAGTPKTLPRERLLMDYKSYVALKTYIDKHKPRGRTTRIWNSYFRNSWGNLPLAGRSPQPRHTDCPMEIGSFPDKPAFHASGAAVCGDRPPQAETGRCP
jgi:hypothetical protein